MRGWRLRTRESHGLFGCRHDSGRKYQRETRWRGDEKALNMAWFLFDMPNQKKNCFEVRSPKTTPCIYSTYLALIFNFAKTTSNSPMLEPSVILDLKSMACCCRYTVLHLTLLIPHLVDDNFDNYVLNFKGLINASTENASLVTLPCENEFKARENGLISSKQTGKLKKIFRNWMDVLYTSTLTKLLVMWMWGHNFVESIQARHISFDFDWYL